MLWLNGGEPQQRRGTPTTGVNPKEGETQATQQEHSEKLGLNQHKGIARDRGQSTPTPLPLWDLRSALSPSVKTGRTLRSLNWRSTRDDASCCQHPSMRPTQKLLVEVVVGPRKRGLSKMVDENLALFPTPLRKPPPQRDMACLRHHQHSGDIRMLLVNHVETVTPTRPVRANWSSLRSEVLSHPIPRALCWWSLMCSIRHKHLHNLASWFSANLLTSAGRTTRNK